MVAEEEKEKELSPEQLRATSCFQSGFGFLNLLLLAKLLVSLQLFLGSLLKSFGFPVYVSERVSILLAFHRIYSRGGFYSPKCSLGRLVGSHDCGVTILEGMARHVSAFVDRHPTVKMLALSFLLLIGVTVITEGVGQQHLQGVRVLRSGFGSIRGDAQFAGHCGCKLRTGTVSPKPLRIATIPAPPHPSPSVPLSVQSVGCNPLARFPRISRRVCFTSRISISHRS